MPDDQLLFFHIIQQFKLMMATSLSSCSSLSSQFKLSPRYWERLTPIQLLQSHNMRYNIRYKALATILLWMKLMNSK